MRIRHFSSGSDGSSSDSEGLRGSSVSKSLRGVFRFGRRCQKQPMRIVTGYRARSMRKLGVRVSADGRLSAPFTHTATSDRLRPVFGRMLGLWLCHHAASSIFEMIEERRVEENAASFVQLIKALHQVAIDSGSWANASLLLPWEDPTERDLFGGDPMEMQVAASWNRGLLDLQKRVELSRSSVPRPHTDEAEEPAAKNQRKNMTPEERRAAAAAKAKTKAKAA